MCFVQFYCFAYISKYVNCNKRRVQNSVLGWGAQYNFFITSSCAVSVRPFFLLKRTWVGKRECPTPTTHHIPNWDFHVSGKLQGSFRDFFVGQLRHHNGTCRRTHNLCLITRNLGTLRIGEQSGAGGALFINQ